MDILRREQLAAAITHITALDTDTKESFLQYVQHGEDVDILSRIEDFVSQYVKKESELLDTFNKKLAEAYAHESRRLAKRIEKDIREGEKAELETLESQLTKLQDE